MTTTTKTPANVAAARRLLHNIQRTITDELGGEQLRKAWAASEALLAAGLEPSGADGWPATTPGNGASGGGSGRTITVADEHGQPDHVPVTTVEAAVLTRLRGKDEWRDLALCDLADWHAIATALESLRHRRNLVASMRSTATTEDAPQCYVASVIHKLPHDDQWEPFVSTSFRGYLPSPWGEERKVCRWVYDFTRAQHRTPSRDEMLTHLQRGVVRISA